jgi:PAS domain S-box-containing protein
MRFIRFFIFVFILFSQSVFSNELKKVSLQLQWKHQFEFAGFYMAKEKGYYQGIGVDVTFKEFDNNINITDDVVSGKTTFGINYPNIIYEKANGKNVVLLSAILQSSPHVLLSLESSNIKSIEDFKGRTIMTSDDALTSAPFISMLQKSKLSFDALKQIPHTFNMDDIINKKADIVNVFTSNEPFYLKKKNIKFKLWDPRDYGFDFYDVILFTSQKQLKENPKMVNEFNKASLKGWEYAFSNVEESVELILKKYNTQNKTKEALLYEANILKKLAYYHTDTLGKIDHNKIQRIYDIYNLLGYTKNKIDLDQFIVTSGIHKNQKNLSKEEKSYIKKNTFNIYLNNWLPISIYDEKSKEFSGLSLDYWNKITEYTPQLKSNLIYTSGFVNSINKLKNDPNGIMISLSHTKDRAKYGTFSKPYVSYPIGIATQGKENFILDLSELNGKKIAVGKNYSAHKLLKKLYPKIDFVPVKNTVEALELLVKGKVYGAADILLTLKFYMQKFAYTNLKIAGTSDFKFDVQIMVNNANAKLIPIINKAIDTIKEEDKKLFQNKWLQNIKQIKMVDYTIAYILLIVFILIVSFMIWRHKELSKYKIVIEKQKNGLETLFEDSSDGISLLDMDGKFIKCNQKILEILKCNSKNDILGKTPLDFSPKFQIDGKSSQEKANEMIEIAMQNNGHQFEWMHIKLDGENFWAEITLTPMVYSNTDVIHVIWRDISEKKQNELEVQKANEQLIAQKEEFETIFHAIKDPVALLDLKSNFLDFNEAYLEVTGYTRDELLTKSCISMSIEQDREKSQQAMQEVIDKGYVKNLEKSCVKKDGSIITTNVTLTLMPDKQRVVISTKDLTELKRKEKILTEQTKLASLGEMIGNIAHQWRQPLSVISTNATGLMMQDEYGILDREKLNKACDSINTNAQYLSKTIDDFRDFIKGEASFKSIKIEEIINDSLRIVESSLSNHYINLKLNIKENFEIQGSKNELEQAIINIINNAKDILIEKNEDGNRYIFLTTDISHDDSFIIKILDNGGGIPQDVLPKIFEPYFTTKHQSQGTGLGLSMVDQIIRQRHGQTITAHNETFEYNSQKFIGACFTISFKNTNFEG